MSVRKFIVLRDPSDPPRARKPKGLLNLPQLRKKILATLARERPELAKRITRVSPSFFLKLEGDLLNSINHHVKTTPTLGKTLK